MPRAFPREFPGRKHWGLCGAEGQDLGCGSRWCWTPGPALPGSVALGTLSHTVDPTGALHSARRSVSPPSPSGWASGSLRRLLCLLRPDLAPTTSSAEGSSCPFTLLGSGVPAGMGGPCTSPSPQGTVSETGADWGLFFLPSLTQWAGSWSPLLGVARTTQGQLS